MSDNCIYIVDGGCPLHTIRWVHGRTRADILQQYVDYVKRKFGSSAVIVFDGYDQELSSKTHEHRRRQQQFSKISPTVNLQASKQVFFASCRNKSAFIDMLMNALQDAHIHSLQAAGNADTVIDAAVFRTLDHAKISLVAVFADDTDVLAMQLYHTVPDMSDVYFVSEGKKHAATKSINVKLLQAGTEGSTVSSLICNRWLKLSLETLSISSCLNH